MTQFEFLETATSSIRSNQRAAAVRRELAGHLDMKATDLMQEGMEASQAQNEAMDSLGDPRDIADAYQSPVMHRRLGWKAIAGIPLLFAVGMTLENPVYALLWLTVAAVIAIMAESGLSLRARLSGVITGVISARILLYGGAVAGIAAALGTLGPGGPITSAMEAMVEFVVPVLIVLYVCWQGTSAGTTRTPYAMVSIVSAAFLVVGTFVFSIGHWNVATWEWVGALQPVATAGVIGLPLLLLATAFGWDAAVWLRWNDLRSLRRARSQSRRNRQADRLGVGSSQ